jgi:DNA ligase-associated metallophosphoesterase
MMKITEQSIVFSGENLILTNQRAVFWERRNALILSDLHLGKAAHFRKNGIALPTQITLQDLSRLELLIRHYGAQQVIVVGDLIHSGANKEVDLFAGLVQKLPQAAFILIRGNHDRFSESRLEAMGIKAVHHSLHLDPIHFIHHHQTDDLIHTHQTDHTGAFICGHLHPASACPYLLKDE